MSETKYYALRDAKGNETAVFTGKSPRQAALKAATRGYTDIRLRERGRKNRDGTYSVHIFKGSRSKVSAPSGAPSWLPAQVWKSNVKKVKVERISSI